MAFLRRSYYNGANTMKNGLSIMITIAVCDDSRDARTRLCDELAELGRGGDGFMPVEACAFSGGSDLLDALNSGRRFDIIVLDILMPLLSGIETAAEIRRLDRAVKIIFLTSSAQFALESYDVKAYGYIVKSAPREKLFSLVREAVAETMERQDQYTLLKTKTGLVKVYFHNVEYLEVMGKMLFIHQTDGETCEMYGTLQQMEDLFLSRPQFIKPHRSYIVNMDAVRRLRHNEIITVGGSRVPVSKAVYGEIKRQYIQYSFQRGGGDE